MIGVSTPQPFDGHLDSWKMENCQILLFFLLSPLLLVLYLLFLIMWILLTVTGIGPLSQWLYQSKDKKLLNRERIMNEMPDFRLLTIPKGINSAVGESYCVALRFTGPSCGDDQKKRYPICIPNGLGATMVTISILHEALVNEGYTVLSFDRLGVGFSDPNLTNTIPTAEDVINEMNYVMDSVLPGEKQWILIGPSMGSIVSQCYMAAYPEKVKGFVNVDGLPYPFAKVKDSFLKASRIYKVYSYLIWTGLFRPFIGPFLRNPEMKWLSSTAFPINFAIAQMNQSNFYHNLSLEMVTMILCCEYVVPRWGKWNLLQMTEEQIQQISQATPFENIETDLTKTPKEGIIDRKLTIFRSKSEIGSEWISPESLQDLFDGIDGTALHQNQDSSHLNPLNEESAAKEPPLDSSLQESLLSSPLTAGDSESLTAVNTIETQEFLRFWRSELIVRVLSARSHDYGNALINRFYTQEMKNLAGAEHVLHAYLSRNGHRRVYPQLNHMKMFAQTHEILLAVGEINDVLDAERMV
jgi:hypothetical protein